MIAIGRGGRKRQRSIAPRQTEHLRTKSVYRVSDSAFQPAFFKLRAKLRERAQVAHSAGTNSNSRAEGMPSAATIVRSAVANS